MSNDSNREAVLRSVEELQLRLDRRMKDAMTGDLSVQIDMRAIEAFPLGRRNALINEMYPEEGGTLSSRTHSLRAIHSAVERESRKASQRTDARMARRLADGVRDALRMPEAEYYSVVGHETEEGAVYWTACWFSIDRNVNRCVGISAMAGDIGYASHAQRAKEAKKQSQRR